MLFRSNLDGIEEWELESSASSTDDEEFPLLVEVSDDKDVSENLSLGKDVEEFLDKLSKEETEAIDSDTEVDEDVYESKVLIVALKEGKELPLPKTRNSSNKGMLTKIRKSSKMLE